MEHYIYDGPVMGVNQFITTKWKGETYANTDKKAISNLSYQFKKQHGLLSTSRIRLLNKPVKS